MENKILVIDNYDSFTYNLVHYLEDLGAQLEVFRNDQIDIDYIEKFEKILLSPGPGIPSESGLLNEIIKKYHKTKNFLGVCLGHQAIAEVLGCKLINLDTVYHGISTALLFNSTTVLLFGPVSTTGGTVVYAILALIQSGCFVYPSIFF